MSDTRPDDLITVEDAARRVDRSKSTVRAWVRSGELVGHREDPGHPENSRLMVSTAELLALVVVTGKVASPGRVGKPEEPPGVVALKTEVDRLRAEMVDALRGNVAALEGRIADLSRALDAERGHTESWRARALGAEAEREALRRERGLPWWKRLLGGPAPALTDQEVT